MSVASAPIIADDLLVVEDGRIALLGSREKSSGNIVFPARSLDDDRFEQIRLPRQGRLWSWTIQRFRPKSPPYDGPEDFEPYAVGYVLLDGALIVEARLTGVAFDALAIDMPLHLVPLPFLSASGEQRTTFAFAPVGDNDRD
jgi:uncharacterized OB-fold protein